VSTERRGPPEPPVRPAVDASFAETSTDPAGKAKAGYTVSGTRLDRGNRETGQCTFTATRRAPLHPETSWHKAPRKRRSHYVNLRRHIGDCPPASKASTSCKWGDGPEAVPGEVAKRWSFLHLRQDPRERNGGTGAPAAVVPPGTGAGRPARCGLAGNAPFYRSRHQPARSTQGCGFSPCFEAVKPAQPGSNAALTDRTPTRQE